MLICVDVDEVIKSVGGPAADKNETPDLPPLADDTVCVAIVEVKVDSGAVPKEIKDKQITDTRNAPAFNTDELVSVSADDTTTGYLFDKLSNNGSVTFTVENVGGSETIKADAAGGGAMPSLLYTTDANIDNVDVSSLFPTGILNVDIAGNREFRSLAGGVDSQVVIVANLGTNTLKAKNETGVGQQVRTEGATDKTIGDFGGFTLVYNASKGYWYMTSLAL